METLQEKKILKKYIIHFKLPSNDSVSDMELIISTYTAEKIRQSFTSLENVNV